jgi:hypothetical protein
MFPEYVNIFIPRAALLMGGDVKQGDGKKEIPTRKWEPNGSPGFRIER